MDQYNAPAQRTSTRPWPTVVIDRLRSLIRHHEDSSVVLVIASHVIMVVLDIFDRATFQSITVEYRMLEIWSESPVWIVLGVFCIGWLSIWRYPPRVIWGLWISASVLAGWGITNMAVGFAASHPVSLLGPSLVLLFAVLALMTADNLQERMAEEEATAHYESMAPTHPEDE